MRGGGELCDESRGSKQKAEAGSFADETQRSGELYFDDFRASLSTRISEGSTARPTVVFGTARPSSARRSLLSGLGRLNLRMRC